MRDVPISREWGCQKTENVDENLPPTISAAKKHCCVPVLRGMCMVPIKLWAHNILYENIHLQTTVNYEL